MSPLGVIFRRHRTCRSTDGLPPGSGNLGQLCEIRQLIPWSGHLLRNQKGRGLAGMIASVVMDDFKANEAAKHAARRRTQADRVQAQIKALRAAERADSSVYGLADRMALQAAQKRMAKQPELRSEAKIGTTTEAPSASSFEPVAKDAGLGQEISSMPPLMRVRARKLSDVEVQAAVDRAVARSEKQR